MKNALKREGVITFAGKPLTLLGDEIKVGVTAPDFAGISTDLETISLSDFRNKIKIISIAPSIDTEVCSHQTKRFNDEASKLPNTQIIAISADLPFALKRFCGSEHIDNLVTLSDHILLDFGIKYGFVIQELRLLSRGVIVLDQDNKVVYVEYVKELTDEPDYDAVLNAVKSL